MRSFLVAMLILTSAFASIEGTIIPGTRTIYQGNSTYFEIKLTNTGSEDETITLAVDGILTWASLSDSQITIPAKNTRTINFTFGGNARPTNYLYTITASNQEDVFWSGNLLVEVKGTQIREQSSDGAEKQESSTLIISTKSQTRPGETIIVAVQSSENLVSSTIEISLVKDDVKITALKNRLDTSNKRFSLQIPPGQEAGNYFIEASILGEDAYNKTRIHILPLSNVEVSEESQRKFLGKKVTIIAENKGNQEETRTFTKEISILERPIMDANPQPEVRHDGSKYVLTWSYTLKPGETKTIASYTIDYIPYTIIGVLLGIALLLIMQKPEPIEAKKTVSYTESEDGRTRINVELSVVNTSDQPMEGVVVTELVPAIASVSRARIIKAKAKKTQQGIELIWELGKMMPGEERLFGYEMSLKFGILGKLELAKPKLTWKQE